MVHMDKLLLNKKEKESFEKCSNLAKNHYENFTVWSKLIRKDLLPFFSSIYAFCRITDDIGDESNNKKENILKSLDEWERLLINCYKNNKVNHPYFKALSITIKRFDIPPDNFIKIIDANRQDQIVKSYKNFRLLEDYCTLSANPVGRLILQIMGYNNTEIIKSSDKICTGLQLLNFCQDISEDLKKGRIYIPEEDMKYHKVKKTDFQKSIISPEIRNLIKFEIERTEKFFQEGLNIFLQLKRKDQFPISLFLKGGNKIVKEIKKKEFDTITKKIKISKISKYKILFTSLLDLYLGRDMRKLQ
ncbi:MAG: squalene synthase HpnC [Chloroflexi bacterium]|nr:squalene synthase HpnC [Chloroflexota bacterium]|tara:strand:+ start:3448 stop:4356 length:909 start_codon:yes stop_codon:yes gene_type:complete